MSAFPNAVRGLRFVVTGAASGLGLETARTLYAAGAHVVMAVRDLEAGARAAAAIVASTLPCDINVAGSVECLHIDLANLGSVHAFAATMLANRQRYGELAGVVNNAGVFQHAGRSADGMQLTFQTNALAPALLTHLLLPMCAHNVRIVNVSSKLHELARDLEASVHTLLPPVSAGDSWVDYGLSKACQVLHCTHLNREFRAQGSQARAFAVEPGLVRTNIMRNSSSLVRALNYALLAPILKTVDEGAATIVYCLAAPHIDGGYYADCARTSPSPACESTTLAAHLHQVFARLW